MTESKKMSAERLKRLEAGLVVCDLPLFPGAAWVVIDSERRVALAPVFSSVVEAELFAAGVVSHDPKLVIGEPDTEELTFLPLSACELAFDIDRFFLWVRANAVQENETLTGEDYLPAFLEWRKR